MAVINYVLYLVITLMVLYPFVLFTSASVFTLYYKNKEQHLAKMAAAFCKAAEAAVKKIKENENA